MTIHAGQFYKACAAFPHEVNQASPLNSNSKCLVDPPHPRRPIRVTEETSAWFFFPTEVVKGRSCYIVEYDPVTAIAVLFLGTTSVPERISRFVRVRGLEGGNEPGLTTTPPLGFSESIYLNYTHPVRVQVVELPPGSSTDSFKHCVAPPPPAPPVGVVDSCITAEPLRLDELSEAIFWSLHSSYHKTRPPGHAHLFGGVDGGGEVGGEVDLGGGRAGKAGHGGGHGDGKVTERQGFLGGCGSRQSSCGVTERKTFTSNVYIPPTEDAPWGTLGGKLRIGFDIPLSLGNADSESDEDETPQTETKGVIVVSDIGYSSEVLVL